MKRQAGYTLLEVVVALAVFTAITAIFMILTSEMRAHEKRAPMNFLKHPQISAVLSRMRRDVQDAFGNKPYVETHDGYTQGPRILIIRSIQPTGGLETIVWDFSEPGIVKRRSYNVGVAKDWIARGVPTQFNVEIEAVKIGTRPWGVQIKATDAEGNLAIDQILQPRAH